MADSAEVLQLILDSLHSSFPRADGGGGGGGAAAAAGECFALSVCEKAACARCGAVTHALQYITHCHIVSAAALRAAGASRGMEEALRGAQAGDVKTCDADAGGCGAPVLARHMLADAPLPPAFALALGWDSRRAPAAQLSATLACLAPRLRPARAFAQRASSAYEAPDALYALRSLVCFFGAHYVVIVRPDGDAAGWRMHNDAAVTPVGTDWESVRDLCARDGLQPCIAIYERE
jgi:hypothetical protein